MPDKFNRPQNPADALYHDVLCGDLDRVRRAIEVTPELILDKPVIDGAWSHGGRRCATQEDVPSPSPADRCHVIWFRADRQYGYLRCREQELFFDSNGIAGPIPDALEEGTRVTCEIGEDKFGELAVALSLVEEPATTTK